MEEEIKEETTQPVRMGRGMMKKLDVIIEQEKNRGHQKVSYATAGEILSQRIDAAGGLKEYTSTN